MKCYQQRGVALISMLLVLAIITTLCIQMIHQTRLQLKLIQSKVWSLQADQLSRSGLEYGEYLLYRESKSKKLQRSVETNVTDDGSIHHSAVYPGKVVDVEPTSEKSLYEPRPLFKGKHQEAKLTIADEQGKFNINNLVTGQGEVDELQFKVFQSLLLSLELDPNIALSAIDWLDKDQSARGYNTEDLGYLQASPSYRAANQHIQHISELAAVSGFGQAQLNKLGPYVTALPQYTKLNVNTASEKMLAAMVPGIDAGLLILRREELQGFSDVTAFLNDNVTAGIKVNGKLLTTESRFYSLTSEAIFERSHRGWQRLLEWPLPTNDVQQGEPKLRTHWTLQLAFWQLTAPLGEASKGKGNE